MGDSAHAASAQRREHRLFPALSLTVRDPLEQATAIATQGGSLTFAITNNGLAIAFRPYVELTLVTFVIGAANPLYAWTMVEGGAHFWQRPRVGERIQPDRRMAEGIPVPVTEGTARERYHIEGPGFYPETFIKGQTGTTRLIRASANSLGPGQTEDVALAVPALPPAPQGPEVTSWCVIARAFELLTDPAPAIQFPTPALPAHHKNLVCFHTGA